MSSVRRDLIAAAVILVVTAVFWTRQDFTTPTDVIFPRFVLAVLALLGIAIAAMALLRARKGADAEPESARSAEPRASADPDLPPEAANVAAAADAPAHGTAPAARAAADPGDGTEREEAPAERPEAAHRRWALPAAAALLIGWGAAFGLFGITLSGVVAFVAGALLIRRGVGTWRRLLLDVGVALAVVLFCWAVFTRVLLVPLPVSVILGV